MLLPPRPAVRATSETPVRRDLPVGAEVQPNGVHFRVWAPTHARATVIFDDDGAAVALRAESDGYFEGLVQNRRAGARYRISVDDGDPHADPASRFQPDGPHGPSVVVDPRIYRWSDADWRGIDRGSLVLCEVHIGTFTREGTWQAAARELPALAAIGVTCLEIMPVADFGGAFGWGYDGVNFFAPTRLYGTPDDVRSFVDAAHGCGLGVVLDVVYNHAGPDGCFLQTFSPFYFGRVATEWGSSFDMDGPDSAGVREFIIANAAYWIREFHLDGLRLDAVQAIADTSRPHIVAEIAAAVRTAAGPRRTWIVGEDEPQRARTVAPAAAQGYDLDAVWNDDFHHSAMVAATGLREAYYTDYAGTPQEFIAAAKYGFLYQGQWYVWQGRPRGTATGGLPATTFVAFLQNHDQVGNSARGLRLHQIAAPGTTRALTALLLLGPWIPLLFQGQECGAAAPFLYFADHRGTLAASVCAGRREFLAQFPSVVAAAREAPLADPCDWATFERCKIDRPESSVADASRHLHASLLRLRRTEPAFNPESNTCDGAVLGPRAFVLRFTTRRATVGPANSDATRLLLVNLGAQLDLPILPEPLLAPPAERQWRTQWSSEDPACGGSGARAATGPAPWIVPAQCAVVLTPHDEGGADVRE